MSLPDGFENYYAILGVPNGVDSIKLTSAWITAAVVYHPDQGRERANYYQLAPRLEERYHLLSVAYNILINPTLRAIYDGYHRTDPSLSSPAAYATAARQNSFAELDGNPEFAPHVPVMWGHYLAVTRGAAGSVATWFTAFLEGSGALPVAPLRKEDEWVLDRIARGSKLVDGLAQDVLLAVIRLKDAQNERAEMPEIDSPLGIIRAKLRGNKLPRHWDIPVRAGVITPAMHRVNKDSDVLRILFPAAYGDLHDPNFVRPFDPARPRTDFTMPQYLADALAAKVAAQAQSQTSLMSSIRGWFGNKDKDNGDHGNKGVMIAVAKAKGSVGPGGSTPKNANSDDVKWDSLSANFTPMATAPDSPWSCRASLTSRSFLVSHPEQTTLSKLVAVALGDPREPHPSRGSPSLSVARSSFDSYASFGGASTITPIPSRNGTLLRPRLSPARSPLHSRSASLTTIVTQNQAITAAEDRVQQLSPPLSAVGHQKHGDHDHVPSSSSRTIAPPSAFNSEATLPNLTPTLVKVESNDAHHEDQDEKTALLQCSRKNSLRRLSAKRQKSLRGKKGHLEGEEADQGSAIPQKRSIETLEAQMAPIVTSSPSPKTTRRFSYSTPTGTPQRSRRLSLTANGSAPSTPAPPRVAVSEPMVVNLTVDSVKSTPSTPTPSGAPLAKINLGQLNPSPTAAKGKTKRKASRSKASSDRYAGIGSPAPAFITAFAAQWAANTPRAIAPAFRVVSKAQLPTGSYCRGWGVWFRDQVVWEAWNGPDKTKKFFVRRQLDFDNDAAFYKALMKEETEPSTEPWTAAETGFFSRLTTNIPPTDHITTEWRRGEWAIRMLAEFLEKGWADNEEDFESEADSDEEEEEGEEGDPWDGFERVYPRAQPAPPVQQEKTKSKDKAAKRVTPKHGKESSAQSHKDKGSWWSRMFSWRKKDPVMPSSPSNSPTIRRVFNPPNKKRTRVLRAVSEPLGGEYVREAIFDALTPTQSPTPTAPATRGSSSTPGRPRAVSHPLSISSTPTTPDTSPRRLSRVPAPALDTLPEGKVHAPTNLPTPPPPNRTPTRAASTRVAPSSPPASPLARRSRSLSRRRPLSSEVAGFLHFPTIEIDATHGEGNGLDGSEVPDGTTPMQRCRSPNRYAFILEGADSPDTNTAVTPYIGGPGGPSHAAFTANAKVYPPKLFVGDPLSAHVPMQLSSVTEEECASLRSGRSAPSPLSPAQSLHSVHSALSAVNSGSGATVVPTVHTMPAVPDVPPPPPPRAEVKLSIPDGMSWESSATFDPGSPASTASPSRPAAPAALPGPQHELPAPLALSQRNLQLHNEAHGDKTKKRQLRTSLSDPSLMHKASITALASVADPKFPAADERDITPHASPGGTPDSTPASSLRMPRRPQDATDAEPAPQSPALTTTELSDADDEMAQVSEITVVRRADVSVWRGGSVRRERRGKENAPPAEAEAVEAGRELQENGVEVFARPLIPKRSVSLGTASRRPPMGRGGSWL